VDNQQKVSQIPTTQMVNKGKW